MIFFYDLSSVVVSFFSFLYLVLFAWLYHMLVFVFSLVYVARYASKVFRKGKCLHIC